MSNELNSAIEKAPGNIPGAFYVSSPQPVDKDGDKVASYPPRVPRAGDYCRVSGGEIRLKFLQEGCFSLCSNNAQVGQFAVFIEQQGGDTHDFEALL